MDRKSFFKRLGIGVAVSVFAPKTLLEAKENPIEVKTAIKEIKTPYQAAHNGIVYCSGLFVDNWSMTPLK